MVVIVGVLPIASAYATARLVGSISAGVIPFDAEADRKKNAEATSRPAPLAQPGLRTEPLAAFSILVGAERLDDELGDPPRLLDESEVAGSSNDDKTR
jgi:hypothetical protein